MKKPFATDIIRRLAPQLGATCLIEPEYGFVGQLTFKNGTKTFFRNASININSLGSVEIAKDKAYASFFLREFGYKVPVGQTFFSEELNENIAVKRDIHDGYRYATRLGFPVIVKPNNLSQGALVAKVYTKRDYYRIARQILKKTAVMIVQRYHEGSDFRIVVLDDTVISAYQRVPLTVTGDGKATIEELLHRKQKYFHKVGRDTTIDFNDTRIHLKLKRSRLSFQSVLEKDRSVALLDNANLSSGGDAFDVTTDIHPDFRELVIRITSDMGLRLCGVDILADDIRVKPRDYVVIEINGAPGLDNYASIGKDQTRIVDALYLRVLKAIESS